MHAFKLMFASMMHYYKLKCQNPSKHACMHTRRCNCLPRCCISMPRAHGTGGGGSVGGNAPDLTKAALEETSALDAVVSWYRDVQRLQIDEGLVGDPFMFPPPPGQSIGTSPPTGQSKAESVRSPGSSRSTAPPGTGGSPPTVRSCGQSNPAVQVCCGINRVHMHFQNIGCRVAS